MRRRLRSAGHRSVGLFAEAELRRVPLLIAIALIVAGVVVPLARPTRAASWRLPAPIFTPPLPWIHTTATTFVNSRGHTVILRGFVTIPADSSMRVGFRYSSSDYARLASLGSNYQSIRITVGALGYGRGGIPDLPYLRELQQMVARAAAHGIYSDFKLSVYDVPGFSWTAFWRDADGQQAAYVRAYSVIWRMFAGNPAVIGYDLLNEPSPGDLMGSPAQFETRYLNPFYREAIHALRGIDTRQLVLLQPPSLKGTGSVPYAVMLHGPKLVFAPHFYPAHPQWSTADFLPVMEEYVTEARDGGMPLMIGEYGTPWNQRWGDTSTIAQKYGRLEQEDYALFERFGLSYSRPWYANDRLYAPAAGGQRVTWAVVTGKGSLLGPLRPSIAIPFEQAARRFHAQPTG